MVQKFMRRRFEVLDSDSSATFTSDHAGASSCRTHVAVIGPDATGVAELARALAETLGVGFERVATAADLAKAEDTSPSVLAVADAVLNSPEAEEALGAHAVIFYRMGAVIGQGVDESVYFRLARHLLPAHPDVGAVAAMAAEKLKETGDFVFEDK